MRRFKFAEIALIYIFIFTMMASCNTSQQERLNYESENPPVQQTPPPQSLSPQPAAPPAAQEESKKEDGTLLGSYETTILDKDADRINNIRIAAEEIGGHTVQPGEVFSFNAVVGKRKAEKGYEKAKILVKGKRKEGLGGGICQLSTTLYNAARKADLDVVERHSHSKNVHYVPKGQDAAVNYGTLDFKFRNNKSYPVVIKASVGKSTVSVAIWKA